MAVKYSKDENEVTHYSVYTENYYWLIDGDIINREESKPHALDMIPILSTRQTMLGLVLLKSSCPFWTQSTMWSLTAWTV